MSDIVLDVQGVPGTPAAGQLIIYADSTSKKLSTKNDAGIVDTIDDISNFSTVAQIGFPTDTYVAGSSIALLSTVPRVGTLYYMGFDVAKTTGGTATPVLTLRFGPLGTIADPAILVFTFSAGTAAADVGVFEVWGLFRTIGAAGIMQGRARLTHGLSVTGLSTKVSETLQVTSSAFNTTAIGNIIGCSMDAGVNAAWTVQMAHSQAFNL